MKVNVDWNKLEKLPGDKDKCFEEFCHHIARYQFGNYGPIDYFYNTPGSEFYVQLNKPVEHSGVDYATGDVIGWQCKFWRGEHDDENSPLGKVHIEELVEGFKTSLKRKPNIKLWIVCTPGAFVEDQWDKLTEKLSAEKADCRFESWHKATFHSFYLGDIQGYNGAFQYCFGEHIGIQQLHEIIKDTLEILKRKFDLELHTPTKFEESLLSIVDYEKARKLLMDRIDALVSRVEIDRKKPPFVEDGWLYPKLTETYKKAYADDLNARYELSDQLMAYQKEADILTRSGEIRQLVEDYSRKRHDRVDLLNQELQALLAGERGAGSLDYAVSDMVKRISDIEEIITIGRNKENISILDILNHLAYKDFSVFAEAGHGKTHFACSVATNMMMREKPAILLTGGVFRSCNGCESKLTELLEMPAGSTIGDALDVLDYLGELYDCKLPIIIDGLNETAPNEKRWKEELPPLRRKIRQRNNLVLITTCREKEEYLKAIYGCKHYEETENPILLPGIEKENLQQAVAKYFTKYRIQPNTLTAHQLFTNPLLLKVFCVTNKGRGRFDVNDYTLANCMKDYSEQLVTAIATENGEYDRIKYHQTEQGLNTIALLIWERNDRSLDYFEDFAKVFGNQAEAFLKEGMCFMIDNVGGEQKIQFSYDLVAGYHIAKAIVDAHPKADRFCLYIDKHYTRLFGEERHTLAEDIIKSLFYLVPLRYGKEWFELMERGEIAVAAMDHLDIIAFKESGRVAFTRLLTCEIYNDSAKERMCERLYDRIQRQSSLLYFRMFLPFFSNLSIKELDKYWNSRFAGYGILSHVASLFHDRYWAERYPMDDKITLAILLCGIVDIEFRWKYLEQLFSLVVSNVDTGLAICKEALTIRDPYILEAVVSVITGIGLKARDEEQLERCIELLERYLENHTSNPVYLLDDLETLYSYGEQQLGMTVDRSILNKNKDERWDLADTTDYRLYALYDYDYEKFYIRPLIEHRWNRTPVLKSDEVHGMLLKRVLDYGYDENYYTEIQKKENEEVKYRQSLRLGYGEKLGRSAVMELYGWLMVNGRLNAEYKNTFRSDVIQIDPSFPKVREKRTFVNQLLLVRDLNQLPVWISSSDINVMESLFMTKLPRKNGDWVLLRGYFEQRMDEKHSNIYLSGFSQLIPSAMAESSASGMRVRDELEYYHAFLGEMGWRHLEEVEEYDDGWPLPELLCRYSFSGWSKERIQNKSVFLLNEEIAKRVGLSFDSDTMEYSIDGETVSAHYINDTDQFFYIRKDVIDRILKAYDAKIRHHLYERRMVNEKLPDDVPEVKERFVQNEKDVFYSVEDSTIK